MNDEIEISKTIKAAIDLANDSYKSGYDEGHRVGFSEGLQAASELIAGKSVEQVMAERSESVRVRREMTA